mgnify:CR=1 FL=1
MYIFTAILKYHNFLIFIFLLSLIGYKHTYKLAARLHERLTEIENLENFLINRAYLQEVVIFTI